ncbi:NlpC/P60 family protein [Clostridium mediterraneense]|uniref:NlpC/P60 family protein n=1 Tax=Clostridium mediterraneense TaxID=1805472 RepID=UPI0008349194|nr:NlpC/P60 family protein [Clostridium mediterraneense]
MARNKIAGLVLASALLVGANTAHAHKHATSTQNKQTTKVTKNEVLLANANHKMVTNAMVVNGNGNLVLRSQGNKNGKIVSNLSVGEMLKIQSYSQNWYKVTVQETGSTGYISADNLRLIESGVNATPVEMNNNGQVINVSSSLNVRENATMASSVIDSLSNGNQVKVIAKQGEWYKININGTIGYVYGEYLNIGSAVSTTSSNSTTSNKVANTQKATPVKKEVAKTNNSTVKETKNTDTKQTQNSKDAKKQLTPAQLAALQSSSFLAIPNNGQAQTNNASSQSQVPQIGSATLTLINATSEQVLSNVNVTINGNSFTTNQQGKVKISSIPTGLHTFTVSVDNYNSTSVKVNVKAGKSMNSIVSLSPAQSSSNSSSSNQSSSNQSSSNQSSSNSSSSNQSSSNSSSSNQSSSNSSSSNQSSSNSSSSNQSSSNQSSSSQSSSNQSSSNQSSSNQSSSNQSSSNSSSSNQGSSNQGSSNQNSNSGLSTSQLQQAIVQYAEQFIGTPYVWGATGPNAFDCSGLTSYVYKHFGYYIGRTTYTQIDAGTPVSTNVNSLQPGDLIFWGDPQAPYHVAIYIGNGQYIQAPKPGETVDISSWHLSDISAARRIV